MSLLTKKGKHRAAPGVPQEEPDDIVTRQQVIVAIVADPLVAQELGYVPSPMLAADTIDWVTRLVDDCRANDYEVIYPTEAQMETDMYGVFDALMPHGVKSPMPGSAADLLSKHVLDPNRDETSLWHDTQYDEVDSRDYCTVQVAIGVIR